MTWQLAVHSALLESIDAAAAVALVQAHGYDGVFWQGETRFTPALSGLAVSGVAVESTTDPERAAELAESLGAAHLTVCGASMSGRSYADAYEVTVRLCAAFSKAAHQRGIRVLLQQRWGTLTASASQIHRVVSNFDPLVVGCVYDAGSMTIEGYEEYRIGLEILGSYVADVHIANTRHFPSADRTVWEWEWSPLSDGVIDLQRLFRALRRADYRGWITLADRSQGRAAADLLGADRHILRQAMDDYEGVGSHNPCRPLDDHVDLAQRPERADRAIAGAHV